jgi:hypothetical protein
MMGQFHKHGVSVLAFGIETAAGRVSDEVAIGERLELLKLSLARRALGRLALSLSVSEIGLGLGPLGLGLGVRVSFAPYTCGFGFRRLTRRFGFGFGTRLCGAMSRRL